MTGFIEQRLNRLERIIRQQNLDIYCLCDKSVMQAATIGGTLVYKCGECQKLISMQTQGDKMVII